MAKINHISHGLGPAHTGHAEPGGNIARDARGKRVHAIEVHWGMVTRAKSGDALGGDHKSALDAVSGNVVVPGAVTTAPGYGNAGVQSGHPFAKPPASKNLKPVAPSFGQRSRTAPHSAELGAAILAQAVKN
jgi:hypothetical protein